jgi:hypothetical protein
MNDDTAEWQGLRSTWVSAGALEEFTAANLRASLRWRLWASRAWLVIEILAFVFLGAVVVGLALNAAYALAALLAGITLLCLALSLWARRVPIRGDESSLVAMIDLTISRTRRSLRLAQTSYAGVAMALGAAVFMARTPWTEDDVFHGRLITAALFAVGTIVYHLYVRWRLRTFEAMRDRLTRNEP